MVATGKPTPAVAVGATTSNVENIVVLIGAEDERRLKNGGRIVDFEFMPTFAAIRRSIVRCLASEDKGLYILAVSQRMWDGTVFLSKGCSMSCSAFSSGTPFMGLQVTPSSSERWTVERS